jgi:hypothetical protein
VFVTLIVASGCGRFAFDDRPSDTGVTVGAWGVPEQWPLSIGGDDPTLTSDLLEMYINVNSADLYRTTRATTADAWQPATLVAELDVTQDQSTSELSADGMTMYFASGRTGSLGAKDIWMTTRATASDPWDPPALIVELSSAEAEHPGCLSSDQLTIVFDSHRLANTDDDLFMATRTTPADAWGAPVELTALNVVGANDESPCMSADGLELYFDSNRGGKIALYLARRANRSDEFAAPEVIDYLVTQAANQSDPWVSPDSHDLVFASGSIMWHSTR